MTPPIYYGKPINSIDELADIIGTPISNLLSIAHNANKYYQDNPPEIKPNGGVRQTYRIDDTLKIIQNQLKVDIFYEVAYPDYLQGSIKDFEKTRSYITNAQLHVNKRIVINEDISNFFPSIKNPLVSFMWGKFFGFEKSVANILTKLTTYQGFLPQGASTSSYIANLIFWNQEPYLEFEFRKKDLTYSRYVDDITVSSDKFLTKSEQQKITERIYKMLYRLGVKPNRKKRQVFTNSQRMVVNKRIVNSTKPTLPSKEKNKIRAAVKECEITAKNDRSSKMYIHLFKQTYGRVTEMSKLHPKLGDKYKKRLNEIFPIR